MAWRFRPGPEVVRRRNKPFAKMMQPDTVYQNSRRQWVVFAHNRPSQVKPAAAVGKRSPIRTRENLQKLARYHGSFVPRVAADEYGRIVRPAQILQDHRSWR